MRVLTLLVVVGVGLCAGWIGGWVSGSANSEHPTDPEFDPASGPGTESTTPPASATDSEARPRAPTTAIGGDRRKNEPSRDPVATSPLSGDGVITGIVFNADKLPIAGLDVVAEPRISWYDKPNRAAMIRAHQRRLASRRSATTSADGQFTLDGISPDVQYVVHVPDLPWRSPGEQRRTVKAAAHVSFVPRRDPMGVPFDVHSYPIDLRIVDGLVESPVEFARTRFCRGADSGPQYFVSALRRWNRLQPELHRRGSDDMTVQATAHGVFASAPVVVSADAAAPVVIELSEVNSVHGHFVAPFRIGLRLRAENETEWQSVSCDETDSFHLIGIECGSYLLQAYTGRAEEVQQEWRFDVVPGFQRLRIEYAPKHDFEVMLEIVDAAGRPVGGLGSVTTACGGRSVGESLRAIEPGLYTLELSSFLRTAIDDFPDKPLELSVSDDKRGKGCVEVPTPDWRGRHRIQLTGFGSISLEFDDYLGSGFEGLVTATVAKSSGRHAGEFLAPRIPNAVGTGHRTKLPTGDYWVVATYEETPRKGVQYFERGVTVTGGNVHVDIPLPELHDVTMRFPGELHSEEYHLSAESQFHSKGLVADAVSWNLPAADYQLRVGRQRMIFRVPGGSLYFAETQFRYARLDRSLFHSEYIQELGLRSRDLIVAVDGSPFADAYPMKFISERLKQNGRVRLTIRRDVDFDVTIDAALCERLPRILGCLPPIDEHL